MLKWAVNGARQSYLPTTGCEHAELNDLPQPLSVCRQRLKRKSSEVYPQRKKLRWDDKENLISTTSTPLPSANHAATNEVISPLRSLADISNILLENTTASPPAKTPEKKARVPKNYASTLPTFDIEYSPNGLIPGPILAMRGMRRIPEAYFEKPRYLTAEEMREHLEKRATTEKPKIFNPARNFKLRNKSKQAKLMEQPIEEESSLSSSRMGDLTLDRMIDAILESTRKERKVPRYAHLSPTYAAAEDPASDLHEYWDQVTAQYLPHLKPSAQKANIFDFNEREVRSSPSLRNSPSYQLNRQRAVRRKRLKLGRLNRIVHEEVAVKPELEATTPLPAEEPTVATKRNISPDSGHNSTSDLEDFNEEQTTLEADILVVDDVVVDATKRRLNFSHNQSLLTTE